MRKPDATLTRVTASLILKALRLQVQPKIAASTEEKNEGQKKTYHSYIMGKLLAVVVHAANIHDTKSGINPAKQAFEKYPTIQKFCADEGHRKSFENDVSEMLGLGVDISKRIKPEFEILPKRWVVECTFAWLNGFRRLSKDYEITSSSEEAHVIISHCAVLLKRL